MTIEWNDVLIRLKPYCPDDTQTIEDALIWLYETKGLSLQEIETLAKGECCNRSIRTKLAGKVKIRCKGGAHNVKLKDIPEEDYKTMTYKQLAKKYHVDRTTIYRHIKKYEKKSKKLRAQ